MPWRRLLLFSHTQTRNILINIICNYIILEANDLWFFSAIKCVRNEREKKIINEGRRDKKNLLLLSLVKLEK